MKSQGQILSPDSGQRNFELEIEEKMQFIFEIDKLCTSSRIFVNKMLLYEVVGSNIKSLFWLAEFRARNCGENAIDL